MPKAAANASLATAMTPEVHHDVETISGSDTGGDYRRTYAELAAGGSRRDVSIVVEQFDEPDELGEYPRRIRD